MALQLLKRNYTMQGYEAPKILKLPQGEVRWAPRRLPIDIGDIMMNIRMDDDKNRYIGEHVSKYAQGLNPYGEWNYPYKVNKNNIRPPIIDPKFYEPLSRMPVKFDAVTAGPIVKDLYGKRVEVAKVAPHTIIDKICPDIGPRPMAKSKKYNDERYREGSIALHLKQPRTSIPYVPSMPTHAQTGVPSIELDGKMIVRPQMGIHFPFHVSDQSRDIGNMRTPMHVAVKPGYKVPGTYVTEINDIELEPGMQVAAQSNLLAPTPTVSNLTRDGYDLTPKVQTSAWLNPSYYSEDTNHRIGAPDRCIDETKINIAAQAKPNYRLVDNNAASEQVDSYLTTPINVGANAPSNYKLVESQGPDVPITTRVALNAARNTNVSSRLLQEGKLGEVTLRDTIQPGEFSGKANVPTVQAHQTYGRARENKSHEYFYIENKGKYGPVNNTADVHTTMRPTQSSAVRNRLQLQEPRMYRTGLEPAERINPVGTGRFVQNPF